MTEIVGLGQLFDSLPLRAVEALNRADQIVLQSAEGRCAEEIMRRYGRVATLDPLYETAADFDQLYAAGAQKIEDYAREAENLVFCCYGEPDGNGFVVELRKQNVDMTVAGCTDPAAEAIYLAGATLQVADYASFEARGLVDRYIDTSAAAVIVGIDDEYTASDVKIALGEYYPDDCRGVLVVDGNVRTVALDEIDREHDWSPSGVLVLPALALEDKERFTYVDTLHVMKRLRAEDGCPWDREQTHESLRPYLIEEAYEVSDAAGSGDMHALADELGDVLLQVIFHANIAKEEGDFTDVDVTTALCEKMIRRHPHVFGTVDAATTEQVLVNWEKIKQQESGNERHSALDGVPDSMDPLMRALKLQQKAARVGFDWPSPAGAVDKVREEVGEFADEIGAGSAERRRDEAGDLLFAAINALRLTGIDPQSALQNACRKFTRRFEYMEDHAPRPLQDMTLDEMDVLWDEAKEQEHKDGGQVMPR